MIKEKIEFKKTGGPYGDECCTYDVIFPKGIEVCEFINYIVKEYSVKHKEWGFFIVNGKRLLEYNRGSAFYQEPWTNCAECEPILITIGGKKISKIDASGGWSRMDYDLYLEESNDQT